MDLYTKITSQQNREIVHSSAEMLKYGIQLSYISYFMNSENPDKEKFLEYMNNLLRDILNESEQDIFIDDNGICIGTESWALIREIIEDDDSDI